MNVCYRVALTQYERDELGALLSGGKHPARKLKRAQILLAADAGVRDEDIAIGVGIGGSTVYRSKRRFIEGNLERALSEEPRPGAERKLTGKRDGTPFEEQDDAGILAEQELLLQQLDPPRSVTFRSNHASNCLPLAGTFPDDRERLLALIALARGGAPVLRPEFMRGL